MTRTIRAPRGTQLTCKNWLIEAAYRMLQNNLDPRRGLRPGQPDRLRRPRAGRAQLGQLRRHPAQRCETLEPDETLLVQSGKPVAVFRTHTDAPRVLIANSNIVPPGRRRRTSTSGSATG